MTRIEESEHSASQMEPDPIQPMYIAKALVEHPYLMAVGSLGSLLSLGILTVLIYGFGLGGADGNFLAIREPLVQQMEILRAIQAFKEPEGVIPQQTEEFDVVVVFFKADNVFALDNLRKIQEIEARLTGIEGWNEHCLKRNLTHASTAPCAPALSPTSLFDNCTTQACINRVITEDLIFTDTQGQKSIKAVANNAPAGLYFGKQFDFTSLSNPATRTVFNFGGPLAGYTSLADKKDEQGKSFDAYFKKWIEEFKKIDEDFPELEISHLGETITNIEIIQIVNQDFLLATAAFVIVFVIVALQTQSLFLASFGMFHIISSYFCAYFIYRMVLQIELSPSINLLALFIILGIGADDIFVFLDAWKQSAHLGPEITSDPAVRMTVVFRKAAFSMLVTSFTTFMAFVATAISPVPFMASFGIMAAAVVLMNYILVITYFPAMVVIWDKFLAHRCCFRPTEANMVRKEDPAAVEMSEEKGADTDDGVGHNSVTINVAPEGQKEHDSNIEQYRAIERFFYGPYANTLYTLRYLVLAVSLALFVLFAIGATQLRAPDAEPTGLPEDAPATKAFEVLSNDFAADPEVAVVRVYWIWGTDGTIERKDRDGKKLDPNDNNPGTPNYISSFDMSSVVAQTKIAAVCDTVEQLRCPTCGEDPVSNNLVLDRPDAAWCFMTAFRAWVTVERNGTFPVPPATFNTLLREFINGEGGVDYKDEAVVFDNGNPKMAMVSFMTPISQDPSNSVMRQWYELWESRLETFGNTDGIGRPFQTTLGYGWMRTTEVMTRSVYLTILLSIILAFVMLNLATWNVIISSLATFGIIAIVCGIMSVMWAIGWKLGFTEAIGCMMLVGLAVDYTVHLANSFNEVEIPEMEDRAQWRFFKVRAALQEMGVSVLGGAVTTLSSGFILFFTALPFFQTFGRFIFITICLAFVVSLTFFMDLLLLVGPLGEQGDLKALIMWILQRKSGKGKSTSVA